MAKAFARGRPIAPLVLTAQERSYLERQVRRHRVARSLSERCLRCADGLSSKSVAAELGVHEHTVGKWRRRFLADRCAGLLDEARPGRPRTIDDDQVAAVIERTLHTLPADATHWSIRSMATETGFSHTTIRLCGARSACSRTAARPSSCQPIRCSSTRCAISSAFTSRRPAGRLSLALTRKARSRRSIGNSRSCR
jgi:transposase